MKNLLDLNVFPYTNGYDSYLYGYNKNDCPYEKGTTDEVAWLEGWDTSFMENEGK